MSVSATAKIFTGHRDYPGLIRKYYDRSGDGKMVYLWKSRDEAEKFHSEEWKRIVTEKYGSAPSLVFCDCSVVVDNTILETVDDWLVDRVDESSSESIGCWRSRQYHRKEKNSNLS